MAWVTKDSVEQYETPESKKEYTKQEKAANWWYYHKLYVGIAVIAVVLVVWMVHDVVTRVRPDYRVGYVGSSNLPTDTVTALENTLAAYCDDRNGDGKLDWNKGEAPMIQDLIGGQVPVAFDNLPASLPHIQAGKLRAIAVGSPQRVAMLPDVKTIAEQGFKGYEAVSWGGLMAPPGTPKAVVDRIAGEVKQILADKEIQDKLLTAGAIAAFQSPDQMAQRIKSDYAKWGAVIRDKGISNE